MTVLPHILPLVTQPFTMDTDLDLPTLIRSKDNLNVLRYIRVHQLREPELVLKHGKALLGQDLKKSMLSVQSEVVRMAILEQIFLAALDARDLETAETCLARLIGSGIDKSAARFQLLFARLLEASDDLDGAGVIYDKQLKKNPSNSAALKRKYCLLKAVPNKQIECVEALNVYLQQNYSDTGAWYELAQLHQYLGDWKRAVFCLEEVLLASPSSSKIHCELAECYATSAGVGGGASALDNLLSARKHMAAALELDAGNKRAKFGLVTVANMYLEAAASIKKKEVDEFEIEVAQELVKYGAEKVLLAYKGSPMFAPVQALMKEYTDNL
jgi:ER membrane protein complex subunit 2